MRRKFLIAAAATVVLAGAVGGAALAWRSDTTKSAAETGLPPATARIERTTLVDTTMVAGTLGYGDPVPIGAAGGGTLTWIAPVGSTVQRGQPLFKVDERPVVALYGSVPLYRPLRGGVSDGADIQQLEQNLAEMGYAGFTVDDTYTAATATALRAWQISLGLAPTGAVEPGQAIFTPGPIRIAEHTGRVGQVLAGSSEGGASVLSYTGTTRLVTVQLQVADQALAVAGRRLSVHVPGRDAVEGTISQVGRVITAPASTASDTDSAATAAGSTSPAATDVTIPVTVSIADQQALGSLEAAPVDVDFVSDQRDNVLAVPVAALLALTQGGYGVQIVDGTTTRIVPVETGMFAAGQVEISGDGIAEGEKVGVPE